MTLDPEWILGQKRRYGERRRALAPRFLTDVVSHARQYCHDSKKAFGYTGNYERALGLSRALNEWSFFVALVRFLGDFYIDSGRWRPWQAYSDAALSGLPVDDETVSEIQRCRCRLFFRLGDYERMEEALDTGDAAAHRGGCLRTAAALLYLRGALARKRRDYDLARRCCRESLDRWRALGDRFETAVALYNLAAAEDEDETGDLATAIRCYEECLPLFEETGHPDRVGRTLMRMARALHIQGNSQGAAARLVAAEGLVDRDLQPREWINLLFLRARVEKVLGQSQQAESLAREAIELAHQREMKREEREIETFLSSLEEPLREVTV